MRLSCDTVMRVRKGGDVLWYPYSSYVLLCKLFVVLIKSITNSLLIICNCYHGIVLR